MSGTTLELAPAATPSPLLPMEPDQARVMMERYTELCRSLLTPEDMIGIPGQPGGFVKRSGFSKLATFYGVSTEIVHQDVQRDDEGEPARAHAVVRASAMNGRRADGDGACAVTEPRFKNPVGRQKVEHDLMATAVTRATNRAISNLIGFGSVSAEEVEPDVPEQPQHAYGEPATGTQTEGLLRAVEQLGATAAAGDRIIKRAGGYLPKIAALAVMFVAADAEMRAADAEAEAADDAKPEDSEDPPSVGNGYGDQ